MPSTKNSYERDGAEQFWLGPKDETKHVVYHMQSNEAEGWWLMCTDDTVLDPNYSEFSVRIYDPKIRSLSFVYRTLAILPKSKLRSIYNLIGRYLDEADN